jgi:hypothetical protein
MDLLVFVLYIAVLSWWEVYLRTVESPNLLGALVALGCSIYLVHFTIVSAFTLLFGSIPGLYEETD